MANYYCKTQLFYVSNWHLKSLRSQTFNCSDIEVNIFRSGVGGNNNNNFNLYFKNMTHHSYCDVTVEQFTERCDKCDIVAKYAFFYLFSYNFISKGYLIKSFIMRTINVHRSWWLFFLLKCQTKKSTTYFVLLYNETQKYV